MMSKVNQNNSRKAESGNVLFLILIAVALFAALSYAVTQSTRSGGGDAGSETSLVNSAQLTQYPSSVRTSMIRMMVSKNIALTQLVFDIPPFTNLDDDTKRARGVFHPLGGGATYAPAPADVMDGGAPGPWYFNAGFEVENIGTSGAGLAGNEIIAFLPGVKPAVCQKINEQLGITGDVNSDVDLSGEVDEMILIDDAMADSATSLEIGDATSTDTAGLAGQAFGCIQNNNTDVWIYYHVLLER